MKVKHEALVIAGGAVVNYILLFVDVSCESYVKMASAGNIFQIC